MSKSRKNWKEFSEFVLKGIRTYNVPISILKKDVTKTPALNKKIKEFIRIIEDIRKNHQLTNYWINHPIMIEFKKAIVWALKYNYVLPPPSQRQPGGSASKQAGGGPSFVSAGLQNQSPQQGGLQVRSITLDDVGRQNLKMAIDKHIINKDPDKIKKEVNLAYFQVLFSDMEFRTDSKLPTNILDHPKFVDYVKDLAVKHMYTSWFWKDDDGLFKYVSDNNSMVINEKNIYQTDAKILLPNNHQVNIIYCNEDEAIQDGSSWYRYFCRKTLPPSKRYAGKNALAPGHNADQAVKNQRLKDAKVMYGMVVGSSGGATKSNTASSSSFGGATKSNTASSSSPGGATKSNTTCPSSFAGSTSDTVRLISEYIPSGTVNVWITEPVALNGKYVFSEFINNKPMWMNGHRYIVYHNGQYIIASNGQILYKCEKTPRPNEPVLSNVGWKRTHMAAAMNMKENIIVYYENLDGNAPCSIEDLYFQTCFNSPSSNMPEWGDVTEIHQRQFRRQQTNDWTQADSRVSCRNVRVPRLISNRTYDSIVAYRQWIGDTQGFPTTVRGPNGPKIAGTWSWELPYVLKFGIPSDDWFDNIQNKDLYRANLGSADQEFFDRDGHRHTFVGFFQPHNIKTTSCSFEDNGKMQCGISPKNYFRGMMHRLKEEKNLNELNKPRMSIVYHATKSADIYKKIVVGDFKTMTDAATARLYGNGVYAAVHPYINYCMGGVADNKVTYANGMGPNNNYFVIIVANAVARPSYETRGSYNTQPEYQKFFTGGSINDNGIDPYGNEVRSLPLPLNNREIVFFQDSASNWSHIIGLAIFTKN